MPDFTKRGKEAPSMPPVSVFILFIIAASLFVFGVTIWKSGGPERIRTSVPDGPGPSAGNGADGLEPFADAEEFREWLRSSRQEILGFGGGLERAVMAAEAMQPDVGGVAAPSAPAVERVSGTNVQVLGIDEPDIVKTDGKEIFYSPQGGYPFPVFRGGWLPEPAFIGTDEVMVADERMFAPEYRPPSTKAIRAFPPDAIAIDAEIEESGELLLHEHTLLVLIPTGVVAYDVTDPQEPERLWDMKYEGSNHLVAARRSGDKAYLVVRDNIDPAKPCPLSVAAVGTEQVTVACGGIWHPVRPVPADTTYTVMAVDMRSGDVEATVTFTGTWQSSAVYMSNSGLYVTYGIPGDLLAYVTGFFGENRDIVPASTLARLTTLAGIDISERAKLVELQVIFEEWISSLDEDTVLLLESELTDRADAYLKAHVREFERTGIVKVGLDDLSIRANGAVPGTLLNQFSLDEHASHLRVATTVGGSGGLWQYGFRSGQTVNDVYVLDASLRKVGAIEGLGIDERIFSARFMGDVGYLVTFRQIDPFYVLDLSVPSNPRVTGELKIPGYSSYLHELPEAKVLGVGKEGQSVKLSLFDVSDPADPQEADKYILDEFWSDVLDTHHAFLHDAKHGIFFMPGGRGGYVFSYGIDDIRMVRAVSGVNARRALFINDYLYIVGDDRIVVLDENDWKEVAALDLRGN